MAFESNPELGAALEKWEEEIAWQTREREHQWLVESVRQLQAENYRIKKEIGRRDRFILWHALDAKFQLSDLSPFALMACSVWYFRDSWWKTALSLLLLQVSYGMYIGKVVEPRLQAKRDEIFKKMEGQTAEDY